MKLTTLQNYVEQQRAEYYSSYAKQGVNPPLSFEEESLIYAIQDYYSMKGEFSAQDRDYLLSLGFDPTEFCDHYELWDYGVNGKDCEDVFSYTIEESSDALLHYQELEQKGHKLVIYLCDSNGDMIEVIKTNIEEVNE